MIWWNHGREKYSRKNYFISIEVKVYFAVYGTGSRKVFFGGEILTAIMETVVTILNMVDKLFLFLIKYLITINSGISSIKILICSKPKYSFEFNVLFEEIAKCYLYQKKILRTISKMISQDGKTIRYTKIRRTEITNMRKLINHNWTICVVQNLKTVSVHVRYQKMKISNLTASHYC